MYVTTVHSYDGNISSGTMNPARMKISSPYSLSHMPATSNAPSAATAVLNWHDSSNTHPISTHDCSPCTVELPSTLRAPDHSQKHTMRRLQQQRRCSRTLLHFQSSFPIPSMINAYHDTHAFRTSRFLNFQPAQHNTIRHKINPTFNPTRPLFNIRTLLNQSSSHRHAGRTLSRCLQR